MAVEEGLCANLAGVVEKRFEISGSLIETRQ